MHKNKPKVLLLGWDAADWKIINPLIDAGLMPHLKSFITQGSYGDLKTLSPPFSPMLWTSIATGVRADSHGILGFAENHPTLQKPQPVTVYSRKKRAIWNILSFVGYKTNVVNWWPSHPPEPINGIYISEHFAKISRDNLQFRKAQQIVHPFNLHDALTKLRISPFELTAEHILPFIPTLKNIDQEKDGRVGMASKIICECINTFSALTWTLDQSEWDFTAAYFPDIDHFGHGFMKYHPPQQSHISDDDFMNYKNVVTAGYQLHDMMLGTLMEIVDDNTTVILCSDHGFHPDHMRPQYLPYKIEPAAPAREHSDHGIIAIKGPGVKKGHQMFGSSLLDIAPTILQLFQVPLSKEFEGNPLQSAFGRKEKPTYIDSWETVAGNFHEIPPIQRDSSRGEINEGLNNLIDLGYVLEGKGLSKTAQLDRVQMDQQFNLALVKIEKDEFKPAIELLQPLSKKQRKSIRFLYQLWRCYYETRNFEKASNILKRLEKIPEFSRSHLSLLRAKLLYAIGRKRQAIQILERIERNGNQVHRVYIELLQIYLLNKNWKKAEQAAISGLKYNTKEFYYHFGLGVIRHHENRFDKSLEHLYDALKYNSLNHVVHYFVGENFFNQSKFPEAIIAYEATIKLNPNYVRVYQRLKQIFKDYLPDIERYKAYSELVKIKSKGEIIVISGLPRSGTSMMMKLVSNMDVPLFTDNVRTADQNNINGYFEHQAVKNVLNQSKFLGEAVGKAVKIVAPLLDSLPDNFNFKVIFMRRKVSEIIVSQYKMMKKPLNAYPYQLELKYEDEINKAIRLMRTRKNIKYVQINYNEAIEMPEQAIKKVAKFLKYQKDIDSLKDIVQPDLYRNRSKKYMLTLTH